MPSPHQPEAGAVIGGFRLAEMLHVGGLGSLWRVTGPGADFLMVMKIPLLRPGENPLTIVGYEVEQMILPRLSGPHVPRFVAAGDFALPYIVTELIKGCWLKSRLNDRIAAALHDIQAQHVIHLDVKPSNIMVRDDGEVVLIDFGLSHHLELPDLPAEEFDGPIGTGAYISPEQLLARGALLPFDADQRPKCAKRNIERSPSQSYAIAS